MGKLLISLTFLASYPGTQDRYRVAAESARLSLLQYAFVRNEMKELESDAHDTIYNITGLTKSQLSLLGYGYPFFFGKFSTKPFTNFKTNYHGFTIRPEIEYKFDSRELTGILLINKEF